MFLGFIFIWFGLVAVLSASTISSQDQNIHRHAFLHTTPTFQNSSFEHEYKTFVYFVNWGIYSRDFQPQQLPAADLTHVLYAFSNVQIDGTITLSDTYADLDKHYPTDSWNDVGNNVYGCTKQLYILKKRHRHLKTLMSVGGWTYSTNFSSFASTVAGRHQFATTAVRFVRDLGLDGVDVDWEYPMNDTEANNYVLLLQALRQELDVYAAEFAPGYHFLITVACPAGSSNYALMHLKDMDAYVDTWNLMSYDYSGSWDKHAGHNANLYGNRANPTATPFNTQQIVSDYIAAGIPSRKIVLGMPLYGRSFEQTTNIGADYDGVGLGSWEAGIWDYKGLPKAGADIIFDDVAKASYSYDKSTKELISFDTPADTRRKGQYIVDQRLGGAMFWEASGDKVGDESLIGTMCGALGRLDCHQNWLTYNGSKYDNIARGMPGE